MKVVILCGGKGQRMGTTSEELPKPMLPVKGKPIIIHIMNQYMKYGYNDFILPLGYKGSQIKQYFKDYEWLNYDFKKTIGKKQLELLQEQKEFHVTLVDTGISAMTGSRIKKIEKYIDDTFMVTYGDGISDINIKKLLSFHKKSGKIATVTGIERKSQYGILEVQDNVVTAFTEKQSADGVINGGFFVFNKKIFDYLSEDNNCILEADPLQALVKDQQLSVYKHKGFWKSIDTQKDLEEANEKWRP